jgi:hypothetical protein
MKDPLQTNGVPKQLWEAIVKHCETAPADVVFNVAVNLLVNAIRATVPERKDAERLIDAVTVRAKHILLEFHYDAVTGKRRTVFPFTQVAQAPFHVNENKIFPP